MKLPPAPERYDRQHLTTVQNELAREDLRNRKRGQHIEMGLTEFVVLLSPNGTRYKLTVSNAGVLSAALA